MNVYCHLFAYRFQVNCGLEGSSLSSPLDSPDVPITCSGATFQSAESLTIRRQVRLAELSSGQFNDLLIANPHFALMHTLLASPDSDGASPDTPSAKVTPSVESPLDSQAFLLQDSPNLASALLASSSDSEDRRLHDFDYFQFYDEFWQMNKFEYDLQCISSSEVNTDSLPRSEIEVFKF